MGGTDERGNKDVRKSEQRQDTIERITDRGKEQVESAANAPAGGTHADQVAQENQVPDPNVRRNTNK